MSGNSYPLNMGQIKADLFIAGATINDLLNYAQSLGINTIVPKYVEAKKMVLSSWEADGRYDIHMTVKITQLEKAFEEIKAWSDELLKNGFK